MRGLMTVCLLLFFVSAVTAAERVLWHSANERLVSAEASLLVRGASPADSTFDIVLPDGSRHTATIRQTRHEGPRRFVSTGRLGADPTGEFLFVVDGDRIAGTFGLTSTERYLLLPTERPGVQRLTSHSEADMPRGAGVRPRGQRADGVAVDVALLGPTIIDVLVVYTPRVETQFGGLTGVRAAADLAIQQANQAYADSGVIQRLRLAHVGVVNYNESGILQTDLDRLTRPADGFMDEAITQRIDYRADLVHLFVSYGDQSELGWLNNFSTFNTTWSFSVSNTFYLANDAFTRAIGSNQGLDHDWVMMSQGAFPQYSFGFSFTGSSGQRWKTLMSNGTGTRIRRHSNPALLFDGVPSGQPLTAANPADAAQSLNNTGPTIAAIMDNTIVPPPVISSPITATAVVNQAFEYQITATNGPTSFDAAGLPQGLSVNTVSGLISGGPRQTGVYAIDLSATNAGGTGVKVLTLTVDAASDCPVQRVARRLDAWGLSPQNWLGQSEPRLLELCRRIRDSVLQATPEGQALVDSYYQHRTGLLAVCERDPQLVRDLAACVVALAPRLETMRRQQGIALSPQERRHVERCLARLEAEDDAAVTASVAAARRWLAVYAVTADSP